MTDRDYNPYRAPSLDDEEPPQNKRRDPKLATLMQRFVGALIDGGIFIAVTAVAVSYVLADVDWSVVSGVSGVMLSLTSPVWIPGILVGVLQWALISASGQSIGKRIVGTRIVRLRGSRPGFVYGVALRAWVPGAFNAFATFLLPFAGFVLPMVDAVMVFRTDRRSLRDHIAATKVIQVR